MPDPLARLVAWARTVLGSLPAILAYLIALFTVLAVEVVPMLPEPWALHFGGWLATTLAALVAVQKIVARLMPAPPALTGTTIPEHVTEVRWPASDGGLLTYTSPSELGVETVGGSVTMSVPPGSPKDI